MNAVPIFIMLTVVAAGLAYVFNAMFFGGFCVGLMYMGIVAMIMNNRQLREIQGKGMEYVDYLLGED